jgi:hypothetical protein
VLDEIVVTLELSEKIELARLGLVQLAGQVLFGACEQLNVTSQVLHLSKFDLELLSALCAANRIRVHVLQCIAHAHGSGTNTVARLLSCFRLSWPVLAPLIVVRRRLLKLLLKLLDDQLTLLQLLPSSASVLISLAFDINPRKILVTLCS